MSFGCFYFPTDDNPFVSCEALCEELKEIHGDQFGIFMKMKRALSKIRP